MTIQPIAPGDLVRQQPRTLERYALSTDHWGDAGLSTPTVKSLRPSGLDSTLVARVAAGSAKSRAKRGPTLEVGQWVEVSGGVAGARYEVRFSPTLAFQVRVTNHKKVRA